MVKKDVIHIRNLQQALNHGLVFKIVYRVIKFSQKVSEREFYEFWYDCVNPIYGEKHDYVTWIQRTL